MRRRKGMIKTLAAYCLTAVFTASSFMVCFASPDPSDQEVEIPAEEAREDTVEIENVADFLEFVDNCNYDSWSLGKKVVLMADLDLSSLDFGSIPYFNGTFEGNGYTISHVSLGEKGSNTGFFRYIGEKGVVQNLNLSGKIAPSGSQENIGGVAGVNYGTITECTFSGSVTGNKAVGAIAGVNKAVGKIINCSSNAVILATNYTGGIVGKNDGLVTGCISESSVNVEELETTLDLGGIDIGTLNITQNVVTRNDMGGIAGISTGIIMECENRGIIGFVHLGYNVGGIAGRQSGKVIDCTNQGEVLGRKDVGGIVGQAEPYVESEYLEDKVDEARQDINKMNRTLGNVSSAISSASSQAKGYMDNLTGSYQDSLNAVSANMEQLSSAVSENHPQAQEYVNNVNTALDNIHSIQAESNLRPTEEQLDAVQANLNVINDNLGNIQTVMSSAGDSAGDLASSISSELKNSTGSENISGLAESIDRGIQSVSGSISSALNQWNHITDNIGNTVSEVLDDDGVIHDISSLETARETSGVISGCVNHGKVNGDLNAGGIAGTMNIEYDLDPEFDLELTNDLNITIRSTVNDVVIGCKNYGSITAKKNCAGGAIGLQELGFVYGSEGYGSITAESGDYIGGIAGKSAGTIQNCYSMCNIRGVNYVGGISGNGYSVVDCISVSTVAGTGECHGNISGYIEDEEGTVSGNLFAGEGMNGIDNISYAGAADQVTYDEIMSKEGIPEGFQTLTITFETEDDVLEVRNIAYGGDIAEEDLPDVPEKEGYYIIWPSAQKLRDIRQNLTVTAEYMPWTQSVAASVKSDTGKSLFLLVGEFYQNTGLRLEEAEAPETDGNLLYAYSWKLENNSANSADYLEAHFYAPNEGGESEVWYLEETGWKKTESVRDGSYLVADIPCGAPFAVVQNPIDYSVYAIAGCGAAFAVLVIFAVRRHNRRKRNK